MRDAALTLADEADASEPEWDQRLHLSVAFRCCLKAGATGSTDLMRELSQEDLLGLLRDPRCPTGVGIRAGGCQPIYVDELVAFVAERTGESPGLEAQVDSLVAALGGERQTPVDLDQMGRKLVNRLMGRQKEPTKAKDLYLIPNELLAA